MKFAFKLITKNFLFRKKHTKMGIISPFFILALSIVFSSLGSFAQENPNITITPQNLQEAWQQLSQQKSFDKRQWKKLIHFEKDLFYRSRSQVSDPHFFLSEQGYKEADQEMLKTLEAFFWKEEKLSELYHTSKKEKPQHPICKFPARLAFLQEELPGHPVWNLLPKTECKFLEIFKRSLNAQSISFVFSSYYADSPGSAFGHTFFRVNKKDRAGIKKQELLDYGISFAANANTDNPVVYAVFGLAGGFTGTYTNVPYYYKVREYNDFESRDLWSYDLQLSPKELDMLILHFWELGPHYFTYYFFTQNCSYQMLTALEAAAPRLHLTEQMPVFIIPADSVKVLFKEKDLVSKIEYRPSLKKQFDSRYEKLDSSSKALFEDYVLSKNKADYQIQELPEYKKLSEESKSKILDAVLDYSDLKDPNGVANRKGAWFDFKEKNLLIRSKIDFISEELKIPAPMDDRPDISHPSSRVAIGAGTDKIFKETKSFLEFRFALHDLLDSKTGLPKYSQLEFGNFKFSQFQNKSYLDHFSFFKVLQLNPLSTLEKKLSWSVDMGVQRFSYCSDRSGCFGTGFKTLFGYSLSEGPITAWLMPLLSYRYGEFFDKERHRYTYGGNLGIIYSINDQHRFYMYHEKEFLNYNSDLENSKSIEENHFEYRWNFLKNHAASLISNQQESKAQYYFYF